MLDINLFREEEGHDPEIIRESQRRRFKSVKIVDEVIQLDNEYRQRLFELSELKTNKRVQLLRMLSIVHSFILQISGRDAKAITVTEDNKKLIAEKGHEVREALKKLNAKLETMGNLVHVSVPIHDDKAYNSVVRLSGERRMEPKLKNYVELIELLGIADLKEGDRGFYLKGAGVRLQRALINFGLTFLEKKGYTAFQYPPVMGKDVMAKIAQSAQLDEELYEVTMHKYLISTTEQPLCAYHMGDWVHPIQLPTRYYGYSTYFRKEADAHGRNNLGIFSVHQKIEQFCMTSPNGTDSWDMHEEMIKNSEEFYTMLNLPHRVVSIVSGALNNAAAKQYNLEAWFPASQTYRELVSCSNCTDYQSRKLKIRFGEKEGNEPTPFVHLLNSTLTATDETICCILENYQKEDGVEVPEVLRDFMGRVAFLPFKNKSEA